MFGDILDEKIDFEKLWKEAVELLEEAKKVIEHERKQNDSLKILYNESFNDAKRFAEVIKKHSDKIPEFEKLLEEET